MRQLLLNILLFICIIPVLYSQTGVMRVEMPADRESDIYDLIPCGEKGVLLLYETQDIIDAENKKWEFSLYDTSLMENWSKEIPVLFGAELWGYELLDDRLILFFLNTRKVKSSPDNFDIHIVDLSTGDIGSVKGEMANKSEPAGFTVIDGVAFAALNVDQEDAEIYMVDFESGGDISKTILNVSDQNMIEYIRHNNYDNTLDVIVSTYVNKRKLGLVVFNLDKTGKILGSYELEEGEEGQGRYLNTARVYRDPVNNLVVIGTYNTVPARIPGNEDYDGDQATGMFMAKFNGEVQEQIAYTNFLDLDNLRTGLSRKEYYKVQRRSIKEGAEFSLNYSLLMHDIYVAGDNYNIMIESYYPDFKTVSDITYDYWGRPIPQTYTVFEGYKYIAAMMLSFNSKGELEWDNSMEIYNISTYNLEKKVSFMTDSTDIILFYNEGGKVTFKAIEKDYSLTGLVHTELGRYYKGDKIVESGYDNMKAWYDNYFICYGYQRLKNNSLVDKNKRTIFYFTKLQFE